MPLQAAFGALADPTRFAIVESLIEKGDMTASEIAAPFRISKPAVSRHLKVLEEAGMIERRVDRQFRVFRARPDGFAEIDDWIQRHRRFWSGSFDRLEEFVRRRKAEENPDGRKDR